MHDEISPSCTRSTATVDFIVSDRHIFVNKDAYCIVGYWVRRDGLISKLVIKPGPSLKILLDAVTCAEISPPDLYNDTVPI